MFSLVKFMDWLQKWETFYTNTKDKHVTSKLAWFKHVT